MNICNLLHADETYQGQVIELGKLLDVGPHLDPFAFLCLFQNDLAHRILDRLLDPRERKYNVVEDVRFEASLRRGVHSYKCVADLLECAQ